MRTPSTQRLLIVTLNLIGVALVSHDLTQRTVRAGAPALLAVAWATCAIWLVAVLVGDRHEPIHTVLYLAMVVGGSLAAGATDQVGLVPALVGLLTLPARPERSWRFAIGTVTMSITLVVIGALVADTSLARLLGSLEAVFLVSLAAQSRRQYRTGEAQARALLAQQVAVEQERALVATLTERSRIARDLHDVLAHSLGGLAIQLEGVDALLESGRTAEARSRVVAARELAVSGLDDAKRAVTALQEPVEDLDAVVENLVATHRSLGGAVTVRRTGAIPWSVEGRPTLAPAARTAFRRALQELLTNARQHAPGATTSVDLDWTPDVLTLTASTAGGRSPLVGHRSGRPGGNGLAGMRERVEAAGGAMSVRAGSSFVVGIELPRSRVGTP